MAKLEFYIEGFIFYQHMTKELLESKLEYMDILHGEATSNPTGYDDMIVTPSGELRERRHAKDVRLKELVLSLS